MMDQGIHFPNLMKGAEPSHPHLEVIEKAEIAVATFNEKFPDVYTDCSSLYETAKALYKDVVHNINGGKLEVYHGSLSIDQFEQDLRRLLSEQETTWERLKAKEQVMRERVKCVYQPVHESELHVRGACGCGMNDAQREATRAYNRRLKRDFHDVKVEVDGVCGYPDGLLTQISCLRTRAEADVNGIIDRLRKREAAVFKLPAIVHKIIGA